MQAGAITHSMDVAQLTLYAFWIFFFGLVWWIHEQDKKEGYSSSDPRTGPVNEISAEQTRPWEGAPYRPIGNPLLAGVGPGAWSIRTDEPEPFHDDMKPRVLPISVAEGYSIAPEDPDPRGFEVIAGDNKYAGEVVDLWIDRVDQVARYFEVEVPLPAGPVRILLPEMFAVMKKKKGELRVSALTAAQFADIPRTAHPAQISETEEERLNAYFAAGMLMGTETRADPLL
jgi:photosynthetic reaction center H subunit